jgi:Kef-type K+ transport system membrane component KefB
MNLTQSILQSAGSPESILLLRLSLVLLFAALLGEAAVRYGRIPRIVGYSMAGLLTGPLFLGWLTSSDLSRFHIFVDLALFLLLFELGVHVNLRWLRSNYWVIATSALESALTFAAVLWLLVLLGNEPVFAASVAAIAMGTSPAVVMRVVAEAQAQGQVTERLFVMCAFNAIYSVAASKLVMGGLHGTFHGDWWKAVFQPLYLLLGSLGVGAMLAISFKLIRGAFNITDEQGVGVLFGLLLLYMGLLEALGLSVILAPLLGGVLAKHLDPRPHVWPRHFGTAGSILVILLFVITGISPTWSALAAGVGTGLLVLGARFVAKMAGSLALGPVSGLSVRQSLALGAALVPLSAVAILLTEEVVFEFPEFGGRLQAIVMSMVVVLELAGPVVTLWMLQFSGECRSGGS